MSQERAQFYLSTKKPESRRSTYVRRVNTRSRVRGMALPIPRTRALSKIRVKAKAASAGNLARTAPLNLRRGTLLQHPYLALVYEICVAVTVALEGL